MTRHIVWILAASGLAASSLASGCKQGGGGAPPDVMMTTGGEDGSSGTETPEACPGVTDPECTTNAACGNDEVCSECMCVQVPDECGEDPECLTAAECPSDSACIQCQCVHECSNYPNPGCTSHDQCDALGLGICAGPPTCACIDDLGCTEEDECRSFHDCGGEVACDPATCTCDDRVCECTNNDECEGSMVCQACACVTPPGESDPEGDCQRDFEPAKECNPSIDIVGTEVGCDGDALTVAVAYAQSPIEPMPAVQTARALELFDGDDALVLRVLASASQFEPTAYECEIIVVGQMAAPLGPDDVCQISADGNRFEYRLSAESAALAGVPLVGAAAYALSIDPAYHFDMTATYPYACP